ncbi:MAG: hypothetical protein WKG07_12950 [Hymenobacter sp.]
MPGRSGPPSWTCSSARARRSIEAHRPPDPAGFPLARDTSASGSSRRSTSATRTRSGRFTAIAVPVGVGARGGRVRGRPDRGDVARRLPPDDRGHAVTSFLCCRGRCGRFAAPPAPTSGGSSSVASRWRSHPGRRVIRVRRQQGGRHSLTVGLAEELAAERIWVSAVLPSIMDAANRRQAMPGPTSPSGRRSSEVAATVAFLASPRTPSRRAAGAGVQPGLERVAAPRGGLSPLWAMSRTVLAGS